MKVPSPPLIVAVAVIGAAGFFIGRISSSSDTAGEDTAGSEAGRQGAAVSGTGDVRYSASGRSARGGEARVPVDKPKGEEALARLEQIVRGENALDRSRAMLAFIDQLGADEFEAAVGHFRSLGMTESRFGEYGMLLTAWAQVDPEGALTYVRANTNGGFALSTVLGAWAAKDPESAIAWARTNHKDEGANPFMPGIIRALAGSDLNRASTLLGEMPRSRERGEALDGLLPHLMRQGPAAAREWAAALADPALRDGAMSRLAERLAAVDPAGTAAWLLAHPGEALKGSLDTVVGTWAGTDAKAATAFFQKLPAGETRGDAFRGLVSSVATKDPRQAAALIDTYPGDADGGAIRSFVWHSFGQDPELALNYVGRMQDAGQRDRTYQRTLEFWLERDPAKAGDWIQRNQLPPKVLEGLQKRGQR